MNDHDLLIELKTDVRGIRLDIKDLKDNIKTQIDDHETRIRKVEDKADSTETRLKVYASVITIGLTVVMFVLNYFK